MKTVKVLEEEFKGNPLFVVREFNNGEPEKYPIVSMGIKKAKSVLENIEDLKKFVEKYS